MHWFSIPLKYALRNVVDKAEGPLMPFVALEHIDSGTGSLMGDFEWGLAPPDQYSRFREGDILFGKLRPYLRKFWLADREGCCPTELLVLRPLPTLDPRFAYYLVQSENIVAKAQASAYGAKMPRTSWTILGRLKVRLPPLPEQRAIAAFLDRETARIDALVVKKRQLLRRLADYRTALITRVITKGPQPYAPVRDSGNRWIGEMPRHWTSCPLHRVLNPNVPLVYGILLPGPRLTEGVPYIGAGEVTSRKLKLDLLPRTTAEIAAEYPRSMMRAGELVYAIRGSFGNVEVIPPELDGVNLSRDAARIAPGSGANAPWLAYTLKSQSSQEQFTYNELGAGVTGINIRDLKRVVLPVPPLEEQAEIVEILDSRLDVLDRLVEAIGTQIDRLRTRRQTLITAAVTGQIDVRQGASYDDQDLVSLVQ